MAIIGVVAALTIPTVVKNYRETQLKTEFKKAYSTLQTTLQKTILVDYGNSATCYYDKNGAARGVVSNSNGPCEKFYKEWVKNMGVVKFCNGGAFEKGCVPKYSKYSTPCGMTQDHIDRLSKAWVTKSGLTIITYSCNFPYPVFMVDINGLKGPNKPGYDFFAYNIQKNASGRIYISTEPISIESGGRNATQMLKWSYK